jgi:hypothetical protein
MLLALLDERPAVAPAPSPSTLMVRETSRPAPAR